jgi:uroporphyrinogen III methyltransferase/synthase
VALVTGHTREDTEDSALEDPMDWPALAAFPGTLVFYMGVRQLPHIAASLMQAGRPGSQPVAVVEAGTLPWQRTVTGTLETIAEMVRREGIRPPSITVVGPVAALAQELAWLGPRPLSGLSVAVTRARAQASGLARQLEALGASVVQAPVIRVQPLPAASGSFDPESYDLICVTSANGVAALFERLDDGTHPPGDARALAGKTIAAIGAATERALAERGIVADVVPERSVAESLVEALAELPVRRALVARAREGRDVLPDALRARGAEVDVLELYETVAEPLAPDALQAVRAADYITFTSSSTVRYFLQAAGGEAGLSADTRIVSIGPVTSEALREAGLEPDIEADPYDVEGMIAALLADAAARASNGR